MICGRQLEPSLQYNTGACYSTTAQGSTTEPFRFDYRIPDQYSEATIETFFTVFAVHSSGIYNFNFTDEIANSIGSIVYDKSDYRPGNGVKNNSHQLIVIMSFHQIHISFVMMVGD